MCCHGMDLGHTLCEPVHRYRHKRPGTTLQDLLSLGRPFFGLVRWSLTRWDRHASDSTRNENSGALLCVMSFLLL